VTYLTWSDQAYRSTDYNTAENHHACMPNLICR